MPYTPPFQIDIQPDELTVKTISSRSIFTIILSIAFIGYLIVMFLPRLSDPLGAIQNPSNGATHRAALWNFALIVSVGCSVLYFCIVFVFDLIRSFFPSGESLHCDRKNLTIGKIPTFNFSGKWTYKSFPVASVKQMQFTVIKIRRYGGGTGLQFTTDDQKKKLFEGLQAPEACKILDSLQHLGIDVIRDPAMPMMVEMAESSRKSRFGIF